MQSLQCACISLLDILVRNEISGFRIVSVDPIQSRREKMQAIYTAIDPTGTFPGTFLISDVESAKATVNQWTDEVGCNAVIEVTLNSLSQTILINQKV
jgi:hypothetical protein